MRTLRTFTLKNGFVLPQTPQQPCYRSCFEAVDLERSATASSKNLSLRMAKSGALVFSDLATFTSCLRSMLTIYCTEGVLFGVNLLHWKSHGGPRPSVPRLRCGRRVLQQSALHVGIRHCQGGRMSSFLKMDRHTRNRNRLHQNVPCPFPFSTNYSVTQTYYKWQNKIGNYNKRGQTEQP